MTSPARQTRDLVEHNGLHFTTLRVPASWNALKYDDKALAPFSGLLLNNKQLICVLNLELDPQPGWRPGEGGRLLGLLKSRIERELSFIKDTEVIIWSGLRPLTPPPYSWEILVSA